MDDVVLKGVGFWLLELITAVFTFLAFYIAGLVNGMLPQFAGMIISILAATGVILGLIVKHYCKITE